MIKHYINGEFTGIITPDTAEERDRAHRFISNYNAHYGTRKRVSFEEV